MRCHDRDPPPEGARREGGWLMAESRLLNPRSTRLTLASRSGTQANALRSPTEGVIPSIAPWNRPRCGNVPTLGRRDGAVDERPADPASRCMAAQPSLYYVCNRLLPAPQYRLDSIRVGERRHLGLVGAASLGARAGSMGRQGWGPVRIAGGLADVPINSRREKSARRQACSVPRFQRCLAS